ncbi:hypothetical protein TVAG_166940 [Trichomonas vaginalis G3]|uniref:Uncharacterized protein n=1 Tax=Trichomonas vaginalis (strain ATCC PRA-98 / G3) TaxID=412133 RepID=A2DEA1_TRIV3|nr:hypothetical protein TVAGG3_0175740 [Trichomonas vaginalis G3]EAY21319.1 hypothetical protein TVAG_166940 [Trichomonas vaginalis G3]KAI5548944.1 hypothetical protein TVAGG3_0175740 [Trichomonas vaginalis G3]|eukprot:XP_001582305.1 hypothetical protein [Trichomonas vaginalis G3]
MIPGKRSDRTNSVQISSPTSEESGHKYYHKSHDRKFRTREPNDFNKSPIRQFSTPVNPPQSPLPNTTLNPEISVPPISKRTLSTPVPPDKSARFQFQLGFPMCKKISTKAAEIALLTEYTSDSPMTQNEKSDLLSARDNLARAYYNSMMSLVKDVQHALPVIADLPINPPVFRAATLIRSDLLSRQNTSEFLGESLTNKLNICFPDQFTQMGWQQNVTGTKPVVDWRSKE